MNKLYVIKCFCHDYLLGTVTAWNYSEIMEMKRQLEEDGWKFSLKSNDDCQLVFHAV